MKITTERQGDLLEMRIIGRLDNEWAGHLNDTLDASIRQGSHQVVLSGGEPGRPAHHDGARAGPARFPRCRKAETDPRRSARTVRRGASSCSAG
jgi:hypothetical protein